MSAPSASDLCELSVGEAHRLMRLGEVSPVDLVSASLQRIESLEPELHAWVEVLGDQALEAAHKAEAQLRRGDDLGRPPRPCFGQAVARHPAWPDRHAVR